MHPPGLRMYVPVQAVGSKDAFLCRNYVRSPPICHGETELLYTVCDAFLVSMKMSMSTSALRPRATHSIWLATLSCP